MFQKVLVVEDNDVTNSGLKVHLGTMNFQEIRYETYCDSALSKLQQAQQNNSPFDLLITDLSFENTNEFHKLKSGADLIGQVNEKFPTLKIIIFSIEDKPYTIQKFYKQQLVDAYVRKNYDSISDLKKAIEHVSISNDFYISQNLKQVIHPKKVIEITEYDEFLLKKLSEGVKQKDLSILFEKENIKPSSTNAIEKRLKYLKEYFNANTPTHLVSIAKDSKII